MRTYKAKLRLLSPLATRVTGDALFGCVCWGIRYNESEKDLLEFLDQFDTNPFVISDGFPAGTLPRPLLSPEKHVTAITLEQLNKRKRIKKMDYAPADVLLGSEKTPISDKGVVDTLFDLERRMNTSRAFGVLHMHNTINRVTNTVEESALYAVNEMWFKEGSMLDVYIVTSVDVSTTTRLLEWGLAEGYGADRSTGKGRMAVEAVEELWFPNNGNRCLALGSFIPKETQAMSGLRAFVVSKFGKLGGHYANSMNPFKRPFIMYATGATFDAAAFSGDYVGQLLKNVHDDQRIRHHACAPVLKFHAEEGDYETIHS